MAFTQSINTTLSALLGAVFVADWIRLLYVPGSAQRYQLNTIVRALGWVWIASPAMSIITRITGPTPTGKEVLFLSADVLVLLLGLYIANTIYSGDEDNWFSGRWAKLKNGLRRRLESVTPAPTIIPTRI